MALLDWITPESGLRLEGQGVRLRAPRWRDYPAWSTLRGASRDFLQPWEPVWPEDDLERTAYRRRLATYAREMDAGAAYPFYIFRTSDEALVGGVTISNVRRGVAQMCTIGYWMGQPFALDVDVGGYWLTRLKSRQATMGMQAFRTWLLEAFAHRR